MSEKDEQDPNEEPDEVIPAPVVAFGAPPRPVSREAPDSERAMLEGVLVPTDVRRLRVDERKILGVKTALGRFTAGRMLEKPNQRESELLRHRSKVAFVDSAALMVPKFFDEMGRSKPNAVILDFSLRALKAAGIAVDSVPVSQDQRELQIVEDRERASLSPEELKARLQDRIQQMKLTEGSGK